ncbi:MAG TPA: HAD family phosphatase [Solirubrobacteraceae bacterium]|nr:HAD family phosphatase [Solirubrobacteraceae bacterium]
MARRPSAAVFDNDGLLLDTEEAWTRAEQKLFAGLGQEFTSEHKRTLIGSSRALAAVKLEAILERPGQGEALMDELLALVMEEALLGVAPRPGALELLERLCAAGVPLAVASNSEREFVERALKSAGLLPDGPFAAVVSANDVEHPKPAPDIYLEACRRLDVSPAQAIALEDTTIGVRSAIAAGMFVIGVPYFAGTPIPGASMLADSLADPSVARALGLDETPGETASGGGHSPS